jgi:hypothetical protein
VARCLNLADDRQEKTAEELLDELLRYTRPYKGYALVLREAESRSADDPNWVAESGILTREALGRFDTAVAELRRQHPHVSSDGVRKKGSSGRRKQTRIDDKPILALGRSRLPSKSRV